MKNASTQIPRAPYALLAGIALNEARWTTGFWADRFDVCRDSMIPAMGRWMQQTQRTRFVGNFEVAQGLIEGTHRGPKWNDGDFYKWLESAAAMFAVNRDPILDAEMDRLIDLIAKTQQPDGYIHTDKQIKQRAGNDGTRFADPMDFEMYNMGHLITAACVHHDATGKTNFLAVAEKAADFLGLYFQNPTPEIARHGICPAHLMALVQLYRTTNDREYLDLANKLLNMRDLVQKGDDDNQDRIPFRDQRHAIGHAVRATYLYAGAADIYSHTGEDSLLKPLLSIWDDLISKKLHITGGCGTLFDGASPDGSPDQPSITRVHQAFGRNYQLSQTTAHNETCAAIGNMLWNWRMLLITGESRFADLIEHTLYNSVLAGISLEGTTFFYTNTLRQLNPMPIDLRWVRRRQQNPGCYCCPPNVVRTIAESASYSYAKSDRDISVILYGSNVLQTEMPAGPVKLIQETNYPWDSQIRLTIQTAPPTPFALRLRIPAWARSAEVRINGNRTEQPPQPGTFFSLDRLWSVGDLIELILPMPVRLVEAHPYVEETRNQVAVLRGPIVYCLESVDLPEEIKLLNVRLTPNIDLQPETNNSLPGLTILKGKALAIPQTDWSSQLYRDFKSLPPKHIDLRLIPYFAWDNRGESEMTVWIPFAK